jgi:hypothetical protein
LPGQGEGRGGRNVELIAPLIAEHLMVPQVVRTVAVGTERRALTLGETGCPCAPKGEKCEG